MGFIWVVSVISVSDSAVSVVVSAFWQETKAVMPRKRMTVAREEKVFFIGIGKGFLKNCGYKVE